MGMRTLTPCIVFPSRIPIERLNSASVILVPEAKTKLTASMAFSFLGFSSALNPISAMESLLYSDLAAPESSTAFFAPKLSRTPSTRSALFKTTKSLVRISSSILLR